MSISSMSASTVVRGSAAARANGYRLTTTTSIRRIPCASIACRSSGRSRRARMPPCTAGCSVLTRPSIISGNPVTVETLVTVSPASTRALAVPPVDTSSYPRAAKPRAKSTRFVLSDTLNSARMRGALSSLQPIPGRLTTSDRGRTTRITGTVTSFNNGQGVQGHRTSRCQRRLRAVLGDSGKRLLHARRRPGDRPRLRTPHRREALTTYARRAPDAPLLVHAAHDPTDRRRSGPAAGACCTGTVPSTPRSARGLSAV